MKCNCAEYGDLEISREDISARIKATRKLKGRLKQLAISGDKEHRLFVCESCSQFWQLSRAWGWGNEPYLFRVSKVSEIEWLKEPFVQPDELLSYVVVFQQFLQISFEIRSETCSKEACETKAVSGSVFCLKHHVEMLETAKILPEFPTGRWFPPYEEKNFRPPL